MDKEKLLQNEKIAFLTVENERLKETIKQKVRENLIFTAKNLSFGAQEDHFNNSTPTIKMKQDSETKGVLSANVNSLASMIGSWPSSSGKANTWWVSNVSSELDSSNNKNFITLHSGKKFPAGYWKPSNTEESTEHERPNPSWQNDKFKS